MKGPLTPGQYGAGEVALPKARYNQKTVSSQKLPRAASSAPRKGRSPTNGSDALTRGGEQGGWEAGPEVQGQVGKSSGSR